MKLRCPKCDYLNNLDWDYVCWYCGHELEDRQKEMDKFVLRILEEVFNDHP